MQERLLEANYRFRPPRPSRAWQWLLTPVRRYLVRRMYGVRDIHIRGARHVREALDAGHPIMFAINHPAHSHSYDPTNSFGWRG